MALEVLYFGSLVDITGLSKQEFKSIADTDLLVQQLQTDYPALRTTKFFIAVNQQMIQSNKALNHGDIVALMPPFSGG